MSMEDESPEGMNTVQMNVSPEKGEEGDMEAITTGRQ